MSNSIMTTIKAVMLSVALGVSSIFALDCPADSAYYIDMDTTSETYGELIATGLCACLGFGDNITIDEAGGQLTLTVILFDNEPLRGFQFEVYDDTNDALTVNSAVAGDKIVGWDVPSGEMENGSALVFGFSYDGDMTEPGTEGVLVDIVFDIQSSLGSFVTFWLGGEGGVRLADADVQNVACGYPDESNPVTFPTTATSQVVAYNGGWNLVGLPLTVSDGNYQTLFPESVEGTLYGYSGTYTSETDLEIGNGYWLRFWESGSSTISGGILWVITVPIVEGWNLIAGTSASSGIYDPDGIIISGTLYGYNDGYYNASSIEPGEGYWVRATGDGEIMIDSAWGRKTEIDFPEDIADATILSFKNSYNHEASLYCGVGISEEDKLSFSLPPTPPVGGFDIRFAGDMKFVENGGEILIQNEIWPLIIHIQHPTSNIQNQSEWYIVDEVRGKEYRFSEKGTIEITEPTERITLYRNTLTPEHFALYQNYPNPFNSVTNIRYDLPKDSDVFLAVYDLLGREVAVLVSGKLVSGTYEVVWNGTDKFGSLVSAGVYYYQIKTTKYTETKKLVLLK